MRLASDAHRAAYERVRACLRDLYGPLLIEADDVPSFRIPGGPWGVRVTVQPIGRDEAVVDVYTWLGRGVEVTPELARRLLERNASLRFVALELDEDGDIRLGGSLFAEHATPELLARLAELVATAADDVERAVRSDDAGT